MAGEKAALRPNIFHTYKILALTDASEYNALSDANKDAYRMIISCGKARLIEGADLLDKLYNMFGEGTTTRDNLEALVVAD